MSSTFSLTPGTTYHSYPNEIKFQYKWIIHKFSTINTKSASFSSSLFSFHWSTNRTLQGALTCWPKCHDHGANNIAVCIQIQWNSTFAHAIVTQEDAKKFSIYISLLDVEGKLNKVNLINYQSENSYSHISIITHKELNEYKKSLLPDDNLTILFEIKYVELKSNIIPKNITFDRIETKLNDDLASLFENGKHCDVTLVADEHELHAHKGILASRSDVFAAMFEHDMEESKSNRVIITDCDHEVLKEMLCYIYTGKAPNLNKMANDLLAVCEKYGLENLKYMCEDELGTHLSIDTVAETILLADLYRAKELKKHAMHFINAHAEVVTKTAGWKKLVDDHSHLINEIYLQLLK